MFLLNIMGLQFIAFYTSLLCLRKSVKVETQTPQITSFDLHFMVNLDLAPAKISYVTVTSLTRRQ